MRAPARRPQPTSPRPSTTDNRQAAAAWARLPRPPARPEDAALQALFGRLNQDRFVGRVPRYRVMVVTRFKHAGTRGETHHAPARRILVKAGLTVPMRRRVLLHEMCHAAVGEGAGHGRQFQAQLARLIRQGESWAVAERELYRPLTEALRRVPALRRQARTGSPDERREALSHLRFLARALDAPVAALVGGMLER